MLRASLPLWRRLADDFADRPNYRQKLGQVYNDLAVALASAGQLSEVVPLWDEAMAIQEKLVAEQPRNEAYWQDLANSGMNIVSLLRALPAGPGAEPACRKLVDIEERRCQAFSNNAAYKSELGQTRYFHAAALVKAKKLDDALTLLRRAADQGYRDVKALQTDSEWEPLRGREDFKKLLE